MKATVAAMLAVLAPGLALAVTDPQAGKKDSRIRSTPYDSGQVVRLTSTGLSPLQVIFDDGEKLITISGTMVFTDPKEAKDWIARPSGNVLFLQPLHAMDPSVMFVKTATADGKDRHYSFELRTREGSVSDADDPQAYMTVRIIYPPSPTPEAVAAAKARAEAGATAANDRAVKARFAQGENGPRNYAYYKRDPVGCPLLAPQYVYDDGTRTMLWFAPHAVLPEVYVINQDGKEAVSTTVNETTSYGPRIIVPTVQRELRLRRGGKVCALMNTAFDPVGSEPGGGSGTISANVQRTVKAP